MHPRVAGIFNTAHKLKKTRMLRQSECVQCGAPGTLHLVGAALFDDEVYLPGRVLTLELVRQYGHRQFCADCLRFQCAVCTRYGLDTPDNEYYAFRRAPELGEDVLVCEDCALDCIECGRPMNGHPAAASHLHPECVDAHAVRVAEDEAAAAPIRARERARRSRQSEFVNVAD